MHLTGGKRLKPILWVCSLFLFQQSFQFFKGIMGESVTFFIAHLDVGAFRIVQVTAVLIVMTVETEIFPVAAVGRIVFVIVVFVVNCQFVYVPVRKLSAATGAYPRMNPEGLLSVAFFFPGLVLTGTFQKFSDPMGFALCFPRLVWTKAFSHGRFLPLVKVKIRY